MGGVLALGGCTPVQREQLFDAEADLVVLSASSHSVDESIANRLRAPLVVEGANFGLTNQARSVLQERGVLVIPDILANSSSAAMVALQMASGNQLSPLALWDQIQDSIQSAVRWSLQSAKNQGLTLRQAWIASLD